MFVVPPFSKQTIKIDVIIVLLNFEINLIVEFQAKIFRLKTYYLGHLVVEGFFSETSWIWTKNENV